MLDAISSNDCKKDSGGSKTVDDSWTILLSEFGLKKLRDERSVMPCFKKKVKLLHRGRWDETESVPLNWRYGFLIDVCQCNLSDDLCMVWQVDVAYIHPYRSYSQVITVWDITDEGGLKNVISRIAAIHKSYTSERLKVSTLKHVTPYGETLPVVVSLTDGDLLRRNPISLAASGSYEDEDSIVSTLRFIPLSATFIRSIQFGGEMPYLLSKEEYEVIGQDGSVLLLGRSGTGKTTCLIFRLYSAYKGLPSVSLQCCSLENKHIIDIQHERSGVHQIFVTMSPILCDKIKAYFMKLKVAMQIRFSERDKLEELIEQAKIMTLKDLNNSLVDGDELHDTMFTSVPDDFRLLCDDHFPLFITYSKLLQMLKGTVLAGIVAQQQELDINDIGGHNFDVKDVVEWKLSTEPGRLNSYFNRREVTYEIFERFYWPRMDQKKTSCFDPVLVWSEIISLIKGSEYALDAPQGFLDMNQYLNCSIRCFPNFKHDREKLYRVFEQYEKMKGHFQNVDLMDQVHVLYSMLKKFGYTGVQIDEVYCDEVQDLTVSQVKLLQVICKNPKGFFLAGDTAQTIARGSAFRFEDVSAMMFRTQEQIQDQRDNQKRVQLAPMKMQLSDNYRSHAGIIRLAASVVKLIEMYFEGSIDSLKPDTALIDGPPPIFLEGATQESFKCNLLGENNDEVNSFEFGADQVVLVREQGTKLKVQQMIKAAIVLTICEAKGMEFNDVLLYNFFNDSPAQLKWRIVLHSIKGCRTQAPLFDEKKHAILCSELKHLYTAITRARRRLWIFDSNIEFRLSMLEYWSSLKLVEVRARITGIAKKSSPKEWGQKGRMYFEHRLYKEAHLCFNRANDKSSALLCEAHIKKQDAQTLYDSGDTTAAKRLFYKSAELFKQLGKMKMAAQTLITGEYYNEAGEILYNLKDYDGASNAFKQCKNFHRAAECMEKLQKFTQAIELYKEGQELETAINKMLDSEYLVKVDQVLISKVVRMYCMPLLRQLRGSCKENTVLVNQISTALSLLSSSQEKKKFLIKYGYVSLIDLFCNNECSRGQQCAKDAAIYSRCWKKNDAAHLFLQAALTLSRVKIQSEDIDNQELISYIEMSLECILDDLRMKLTSLFPDTLRFRIPSGIVPEACLHLVETTVKFIAEVEETYRIVSGNSSIVSDKAKRVITEVQELHNLVTGNIKYLQSCLNASSAYSRDADMRILFSLGYASLDDGTENFWDTLILLQKLVDCYRELEASLSNRSMNEVSQKHLSCCERFFRLKNVDDSFYLIAEDAINIQILEYLNQWQHANNFELITDETPLESTIKVWRVLKTYSWRAMRIVLAKWVQEILYTRVNGVKEKKHLLQEPCQIHAGLQNCRRQHCSFVHTTDHTSVKNYFIRLVKLSHFANVQAMLMRDIATWTREISSSLDVNSTNQAVKSADGLSRYWLEKLIIDLQPNSPFFTSSSIILEMFRLKEMPIPGLLDLVSRGWLKNYDKDPYNVSRLLQAFYLIVQVELNYIPYYCRRFVRPVNTSVWKNLSLDPLHVWENLSSDGRTVWSLHSNLFNVIKHATLVNVPKLVQVGYKYLLFLSREGCDLECDQPFILLWLLEIVTAVVIASIRSFHGITLPASVVFIFFSKHKLLCKNILDNCSRCCFPLSKLCELAMEIWYQRVWYLKSSPERFAATLKIMTVLFVCSYHMDFSELHTIWCWIQNIKNVIYEEIKHPEMMPVLKAETFQKARQSFVNMLNNSLDPLVVVNVMGKPNADWSELYTNLTFVIDNTGFINLNREALHQVDVLKQCDRDLEILQSKENVNDAHTEGSVVTFEKEVAAVSLLQSWVRRFQAKQKLTSRDHSWDSKFEKACKLSKTWISRSYRMVYLGIIMPVFYELYKLEQALQSNRLKIRRIIAAGTEQTGLEALLDQDDTLKNLKREVKPLLEALSVENNRHGECSKKFLEKSYREAKKVLKRADNALKLVTSL